MKKFFLILFLVLCIPVHGKQEDSLYYFTDGDVLILANKIQLIRDSLKFKSAIIYEQDSLVNLYQERSLIFKDQIQNKDSQIEILEKQNEVLKESLKLLEPKWYDNNLFWFGNGIAVTIITLILVK